MERTAHWFYKPKSVIRVMMITTSIFEQMCSRVEGAMGLHCNRKSERQMTKRTFSLSQMSNDELAQSLPWREPNEQREPLSLLEWQSREEEDKVKWSDLFQSLLAHNSLMIWVK